MAWDEGFDLARAVKSEEELESVRESFRINEDGVRAVVAAYEVGKTEAELMGVAEQVFTAAGAYRTTMDMVLTGENGGAGPEFKFPSAAPDRRRRPAPLRPRDRRAGRPLGRVLSSDLRRREPSDATLLRRRRLPRVLRRRASRR